MLADYIISIYIQNILFSSAFMMHFQFEMYITIEIFGIKCWFSSWRETPPILQISHFLVGLYRLEIIQSDFEFLCLKQELYVHSLIQSGPGPLWKAKKAHNDSSHNRILSELANFFLVWRVHRSIHWSNKKCNVCKIGGFSLEWLCPAIIKML